MNTKHIATRTSRPGSTPTYSYRGLTIKNSAGSRYGRGWLIFHNGERRFASTLESAKQYVDDLCEGIAQ